jgi:hypothetical protein
MFCCALLAGCSSGEKQERPIAEAFIGPATLALHSEINPKSPQTALAKHGERVAIVRRRRRFVKVRLAGGAEGWTDLRQLLSTAEMTELGRLAERAQKLPSQGEATVWDALNAHTEPNRQAPSLYRIQPGEIVHVVAHELRPRVPFEGDDLFPPPPPPKTRKAKASSREESRIAAPPMPPAPQPPENWLELSKTISSEPEPAPDPEPPPPPPAPLKQVPVDDWTLVRLPNGAAGWVLTGMLKMNIPDEVAQYSEGHRITAYFRVGDVREGDQVKHNWLWTTLSTLRQPYEFDSFRYFIWHARKDRYETAYIERGLKGYFPVEVRQGTQPSFSVVVEEKDGQRYRRTYAYQGYRVRLVETVKWEPADAPSLPELQPSPAEPAASPGLYARFKSGVLALKARWFR